MLLMTLLFGQNMTSTMSTHTSNVMIVPWGGPFPAYTNYFLSSMKGLKMDVIFISMENKTLINEYYSHSNIKQIYLQYNFYLFLAKRMCLVYNCTQDELLFMESFIKHKLKNPYNICDFKPLYPYLFQDYVTNYDYVTWGDVDVIYGDYNRILPYLEMDFDVVTIASGCQYRIYHSGQFTAIRNTERMRMAWLNVLPKPVFYRYFEDGWYKGIDEGMWSNLITFGEYKTVILPWMLADLFHPHMDSLRISRKGLVYTAIQSDLQEYKVKFLYYPKITMDMRTMASDHCDINWFNAKFATCIPYNKDGYYAIIYNGIIEIFPQTKQEREYTTRYPFFYTFQNGKKDPLFQLKAISFLSE